MGAITADVLMHLLNFIMVFVIVRTLVYQPVVKFMAARQQRVQSEIDEAHNEFKQAETLRIEYEGKLENAKADAEALMNKSGARAEEAADQILEDAKQQSRQLLAAAREQIEDEREAAAEKMRDEFAHLAVKIASKVLEREVSQEDNKAVIDQFFEKVG